MGFYEIFLLFFFIENKLYHVNTLPLKSNSSLDAYIKLCGSENLCGRYSVSENKFPSSSKHCSNCDCGRDCYMKGTCCPDLHQNTCVDISLLSASPSENSTNFVYLLSNCPSSINDRLCESDPVSPVKGLSTNISYKNVHCALCNGEEDVEPWGLVVDGCTKEGFDINIYSSLNSIYAGVEEFGCNFGFDWTVANAGVTECKKRKIDSCNVTGLWDKYDRDIEMACGINHNPYTFFSNIFCFICNTGISIDEPLIENCPFESDEVSSQLCKSGEIDPRWFPYKNSFCHNCTSMESLKLLEQNYNFNASSHYPFELTISIANDSNIFCALQTLPYYRFLRISQIAMLMCSTETFKTLNGDHQSLRSAFDHEFDNFTNFQTASRRKIDFVSLYETYVEFGGEYNWCFSGDSYGCRCTDICFIMGDCCADKMAAPRYQCKEYKEERLIVIATCPPSFYDNVVRYYCERENFTSGTIIDVLPIVYSMSSKTFMQYKNIFCLICNHELNNTTTETEYWYSRKLKFRCPKYINIDHSLMLGRTFTYLQKTCELEMEISHEDEIRLDCGSASLFPSTIFSCPSVDRSYSHKRDIIYLCENTGILILGDHCNQYGNFFCEICNFMEHCQSNDCGREMKMNPVDFKMCDTFSTPRLSWKQQCEVCIDYRHLFSLFEMLEIEDDLADKKDCEVTDIFDPGTGSCREISCYDGKEYRNGCKSLLSRSQNLQYELNLSITFNSTIFKEGISDDIMLQTLHILTEKITKELENVPLIVVYHVSCEDIRWHSDDDVEAILVSFQLRVKTNGTVSRDETEEQLVSVKAQLEKLHTDIIMKEIPMALSLESTESIERIDFDNVCRNYIPKSSTIKGNIFRVDKYLTCPQLILHEKEYLIEKDYLYLTTNLDKRKNISFMKDRANRVRVCINDYLSLFSAKQLVTWLTFWDILPTICVCTSTLCLGLTVVTCCVLKQYKTLPGKNILCLIISQLLAQTILLIKNIRVNDIYCMIIAGVTHYTWLTMFFATANCTIHMFMAFNVNYAMLNKKRAFLVSLTVILAVPMLIVLAYLLYVFETNGSYPYKTHTCFIEDLFSLLVFFHLPISIICSIDLLFFILISYRLHSLTYVRSNQDKRNNSIICLKLFLVTGLSWILQLIESFFPFSGFTYAVSLINGCQGIFIFLVLIMSKNIRVAMMTSLSRTDSL